MAVRPVENRPAAGKAVTHAGSGRPEALLRAGIRQYRMADFDLAASTFRQLVHMEPGNVQAWHGLGLACAACGLVDEALQALRSAVTLDPLSWRSWLSIAELCPAEKERSTSISSAIHALEQLGKAGGDGAVRARLASLLTSAGRHSEAVAWLELLPAASPGDCAIHLQLARARYRSGDFQKAFHHHCCALQASIPGSAAAAPRLQFDPRSAIDALKDIVAILEAAGEQPFLAAGTLLGFMRAGAPLAGDRDVDIGVLCKNGRRPDIASIIRAHPRLQLGLEARPGDRYFALRPGTIAIDIFLYESDGKCALSGFSDLAGDIQWRHTAFSVCERLIGGTSWRTPSNPDRYLYETYGPGWTSPDGAFSSSVSSPALYGTAPYARACYAAARALQAVWAGDTARADALERQSPFPFTRLGMGGSEM